MANLEEIDQKKTQSEPNYLGHKSKKKCSSRNPRWKVFNGGSSSPFSGVDMSEDIDMYVDIDLAIVCLMNSLRKSKSCLPHGNF